MENVRYRLVVEGELGRRLSTVFEGMQVEARDGMTSITGTVKDQAHLHGLLDKIASLGLKLVSVAPTNGEEHGRRDHPSAPDGERGRR